LVSALDSNLVLDVKGAQTTPGTPVVLFPRKPGAAANQRWNVPTYQLSLPPSVTGKLDRTTSLGCGNDPLLENTAVVLPPGVANSGNAGAVLFSTGSRGGVWKGGYACFATVSAPGATPGTCSGSKSPTCPVKETTQRDFVRLAPSSVKFSSKFP